MLNSRFLISTAFAVMLGLMAVLIAGGLGRLSVINLNLQEIVVQHDVKSTLVLEMRNAARERAMILHRLVLIKDPFERDEMLQEFDQMARHFIRARDKLSTQALSETERKAYQQSLLLARDGELAQQEVVDLVSQDRLEDATQLLVSQVVPVQNRVLVQLSSMVEAERLVAHEAERSGEAAYRSAMYLMIGLGLVVLAIGVGIAFIVTRRTARIEAELVAEKMRAQLTLHSISDAIVTTDINGRVNYVNRVAESLTGWSDAEARGQPLARVLNILDLALGDAHLSAFNPLEVERTAYDQHMAASLMARDHTVLAIEYHVSPIQDDAGHVIGSVIVVHDVTQTKELSRRLSWAATHDALTGLINRSEFESRLDALLHDEVVVNREHALLYLDLDQFKVVNDTCGHVAGDELLRQLTLCLEQKIRSNDTLARMGGDEFGILLTSCSLGKAAQIAESVRDAVQNFRFSWLDKVFDVGVSIGLVPVNAQSENSASLLSLVDAACYAAKEQGRNRVHIFEPGDEELLRRRGEMNWAQQVSQAIKENRLTLYFQKIVPISQRAEQHTHYELLIRMLDQEGNLVQPVAFIPAAERYGLMGTLDRWVVQTVFQRLSRRKDLTDTVCAINLSGQSIGDESMLKFILDQFEQHAIPPAHICFEITETAAIANLRTAVKLIITLRTLGCRFSLDDFGCGMSSFGYLRQLKVDFLKIDGSFVRNILTDATDHAMVEAINNIGHVMGIQTIAEFVESQEILQCLQKIGVDYAQGYGIHRPESFSIRDDMHVV